MVRKVRKYPRLGRKVQVTECSGIDSGKLATVVSHTQVRITGYGIPDLPGHYKPVNWSKDVAIRFDVDGRYSPAGKLEVISKTRLRRI